MNIVNETNNNPNLTVYENYIYIILSSIYLNTVHLVIITKLKITLSGKNLFITYLKQANFSKKFLVFIPKML